MAIEFTLNMIVSDVMVAIEFYEKVFDAKRSNNYSFDRKGENWANITIGNMNILLNDENKEYGQYAPRKGKKNTIWFTVVVDDIDKILEKAKNNGVIVEEEDEPIEDDMGTISVTIDDPFGYGWVIIQRGDD